MLENICPKESIPGRALLAKVVEYRGSNCQPRHIFSMRNARGWEISEVGLEILLLHLPEKLPKLLRQ